MRDETLMLESGLLLTQTEPSIPRIQSVGKTCGSVTGRVASNTRSGRVDKRECRTLFVLAARRHHELSVHTLRKLAINAGLFSIVAGTIGSQRFKLLVERLGVLAVLEYKALRARR